MGNIPYVRVEFLLPGDDITAVDLCPPGDTWKNLVTAELVWAVPIQLLNQHRSRPDDAHLAFENIDQFGQFVEAGGTQETAKFCQTLGIR